MRVLRIRIVHSFSPHLAGPTLNTPQGNSLLQLSYQETTQFGKIAAAKVLAMTLYPRSLA